MARKRRYMRKPSGARGRIQSGTIIAMPAEYSLDSVVKRLIHVPMSKGKDQDSAWLRQYIQLHGLKAAAVNLDMHYGTLQTWYRRGIPMDAVATAERANHVIRIIRAWKAKAS